MIKNQMRWWAFFEDQIHHTRWELEEGNNVDPDDGNSMVCTACRLPIFSTPFIITTTGDHMHDQCADDHDLPQRLKGHPLHPTKDLVLLQQDSTTHERRCCRRCNSMCGSRFYACFDAIVCGFGLDLACALRIRIQHRSHGHRLEAIKGTSFSFICSACGTQHNRGFKKADYSHEGGTTWDLSYVCFPCDFWIHPDCALLPNAIKIEDDKHQHPLLLTYLGQGVSGEASWQDMPRKLHHCEICHGRESEGFGIYACFHCDYYAHIKCVIYSDPDHYPFKPVLLRDAQVPDLILLPLTNEHTSVVSRVSTVTSGGASSSGQMSSKLTDGKGHEHPLILHQNHDDDVARVCSACVQLISPDDGPFYSCDNNEFPAAAAGRCRDFFLHRCCAHLSDTLTINLGSRLYTFTLVDTTKEPFNLFWCYICDSRCNGFAYKLKWGSNNYLDVVCALMSSALITHDAHAQSHILQPISPPENMYCYCRCCRELIFPYSPAAAYGCTNCHNFYIHIKCALLPNTVSHKFDRHPLKLITTNSTTIITLDDQEEEESVFCEICEKDLDRKAWYYYCDKCEQSFHARCIPCLDRLSKIKFGFTVGVKGHDCPLTCVRALTVAGYSCGHCGQTIDEESEDIAFECFECYFRIHEKCAEKLLLPNI